MDRNVGFPIHSFIILKHQQSLHLCGLTVNTLGCQRNSSLVGCAVLCYKNPPQTKSRKSHKRKRIVFCYENPPKFTNLTNSLKEFTIAIKFHLICITTTTLSFKFLALNIEILLIKFHFLASNFLNPRMEFAISIYEFETEHI